MFLFPDNSKFMICLNKFIAHKAFDYTILMCIMIASILLVLDNPLSDPKGKVAEVLYYMDIVLTTIFTVECILKIIASGFLFNGRRSYMRITWNIIDFVIVSFSV